MPFYQSGTTHRKDPNMLWAGHLYHWLATLLQQLCFGERSAELYHH